MLIRTNSPFMIDSLKSLERIRIPYRLIVVEERKHRWAEAVNDGLNKADNGPALIMEEDIVIPSDMIITPEIIPEQDTIWSGLLMIGPDTIGHGGAIINPDNNILLINGEYTKLISQYPRNVDILSGSFLYLPEAAWKKYRPKTLPGLGWEDIAWQLEIKKGGFKCRVLPLKIYHFCQMAQAITPETQQQIQANYGLIQKIIHDT
jgi:hypothetical protein